jgi:hypothetical protein
VCVRRMLHAELCVRERDRERQKESVCGACSMQRFKPLDAVASLVCVCVCERGGGSVCVCV